LIPTWLTILLAIFLVIALVRPRPGRYPHMQALLAIVVVLAFEAVRSHAL
jgi:hypothetical protein